MPLVWESVQSRPHLGEPPAIVLAGPDIRPVLPRTRAIAHPWRARARPDLRPCCHLAVVARRQMRAVPPLPVVASSVPSGEKPTPTTSKGSRHGLSRANAATTPAPQGEGPWEGLWGRALTSVRRHGDSRAPRRPRAADGARLG